MAKMSLLLTAIVQSSYLTMSDATALLGAAEQGDLKAADQQELHEARREATPCREEARKDRAFYREDIAALPPELRDLIENAVYKHDFWVGTQDGFLHQQLTTEIYAAIKVGVIDGQLAQQIIGLRQLCIQL